MGARRKQTADQLDDLTAAEVGQLLTPEFITQQVEGDYQEEVRQWARREAISLGVRPNFEVLNPLIRPHVEEFGAEQMVGVNATTQQAVANTVSEGFRRGLAPGAIAGEIGLLYQDEIIPNRSRVIARTEMLRASNHGRWASQKASGVVAKREWIATPDGKARPWHHSFGIGSDLHGNVVGMDESFTSPKTGATARYPGDFGRGIDDIRCRCTTAAKIPTRHAPNDRGSYYKAFDDELERSEDRFEVAMREAFRLQAKQELEPGLAELFGLSRDEVDLFGDDKQVTGQPLWQDAIPDDQHAETILAEGVCCE